MAISSSENVEKNCWRDCMLSTSFIWSKIQKLKNALYVSQEMGPSPALGELMLSWSACIREILGRRTITLYMYVISLFSTE
jgi:hypothetical protein